MLPSFSLAVGEVVIEGFGPAEGRAVALALERELGRLLQSDPPARFGADARIDRLQAALPMAASPRSLGQAAARAVVGRLHSVATGQDPTDRGGER